MNLNDPTGNSPAVPGGVARILFDPHQSELLRAVPVRENPEIDGGMLYCFVGGAAFAGAWDAGVGACFSDSDGFTGGGAGRSCEGRVAGG